MAAAQAESPEVVAILIKKGAQVRVKDLAGNTALALARSGKNSRIVKLLEQASR